MNTKTNGHAPPSPPRLRTDADVEAALARASDAGATALQATPLLCQVLAVRPGHPRATALLEGHLETMGDPDPRARAAQFAQTAAMDHPALKRAARALADRQLVAAEKELRDFLSENPADPVALRMGANAAETGGRPNQAERMLHRAIEIAPDFIAARRNLVDCLHAQGKRDEALTEIDALLAAEPQSVDYRAMKAATLKRVRRTEEALAIYDGLLADNPERVDLLIDHGNALRAAGEAARAAREYRKAAAIDPASGRAWWSLADLKVERFGEADIAAMEGALIADDLATAQRAALHFALGRALEEAGRHARAFGHYAEANAMQRLTEPYDARRLEAFVGRGAALVRAGKIPDVPPPEGGPIFVLGMPRSGSTLVEQILAGHPSVEATEELPYIRMIANDLGRSGAPGYPQMLATLSAEARAALRTRYLHQSAAHRREGAAWFVDKAPANWQHIPLIAAILPNARIIDVRRHPLDCGFSNYAQRFGRGNEFAYSLDSIGHYYRHYVSLMRAIDEAWPGRVHRIHHEALVADPEGETKALLAAIGLDYDPACLAFHERSEPVFSASSEQVRRPINREGIGRWRAFDAWLAPLKRALGPVLDDYPEF